MFDLFFTKDDSFLFEKRNASWGAPQENDAKSRFAILSQGIRQFHDNCHLLDLLDIIRLIPESARLLCNLCCKHQD